jgi:hypothetical protein
MVSQMTPNVGEHLANVREFLFVNVREFLPEIFVSRFLHQKRTCAISNVRERVEPSFKKHTKESRKNGVCMKSCRNSTVVLPP